MEREEGGWATFLVGRDRDDMASRGVRCFFPKRRPSNALALSPGQVQDKPRTTSRPRSATTGEPSTHHVVVLLLSRLTAAGPALYFLSRRR